MTVNSFLSNCLCHFGYDLTCCYRSYMYACCQRRVIAFVFAEQIHSMSPVFGSGFIFPRDESVSARVLLVHQRRRLIKELTEKTRSSTTTHHLTRDLSPLIKPPINSIDCSCYPHTKTVRTKWTLHGYSSLLPLVTSTSIGDPSSVTRQIRLNAYGDYDVRSVSGIIVNSSTFRRLYRT